MFDESNLAGAERRIDDWAADLEQRAAQARVLAGRLGALTATAGSDDGLVTVTVGAAGTLTGLELDERVRRQPAAETARQILDTLAAAQKELIERATTATAD